MKQRREIELECDELAFGSEVVMSNIEVKRAYMIDVAVSKDKKFIGSVIPIPEVLILYLKETELRVFLFILKQFKVSGFCNARRSTMSKELGVSSVSISNTLTKLSRMGIITQRKDGKRQVKTINFNAIQVLSDTLEGKMPGAHVAYRNAMGCHNVLNPTEEALAVLDVHYTYEDDDEEYN